MTNTLIADADGIYHPGLHNDRLLLGLSVTDFRAYTQPRNGKGDAYAYCKACHPGAIERRWTRERVLAAMCACRSSYGRLPSSYDWSRAHARRRGGHALDRLAEGDWPAASVVTSLFRTWAAARAAALQAGAECST